MAERVVEPTADSDELLISKAEQQLQLQRVT